MGLFLSLYTSRKKFWLRYRAKSSTTYFIVRLTRILSSILAKTHFWKSIKVGPLTQSVEYLPFKQGAAGSSPARPTKIRLAIVILELFFCLVYIYLVIEVTRRLIKKLHSADSSGIR